MTSYIFFFIMIIFFYLVITFPALKRKKQIEAARKTPAIIASATVISRDTQIRTYRQSRANSHHFVSFELESGERLSFEVSMADYNIVTEGELGVLTYYEHNGIRVFESFDRV